MDENIYVTIAGDTWDQIARKVYGDEFLAGMLMQEPLNFPILDYEVFPADIAVYVPDLSDSDYYADDLPEWRKD